MKRIILSAVLLGTTMFPAFPQEILSLERCKELALGNNARMKNAALSVDMAGQQKKEAFTNYFPSVSGAGAGFIFNKPLTSTEVATGYPPPNDKVTVDLIKNTLIAGVVAVQPVFAGGQLINGNRLAEAGEEISRLQRQMTENEVALATERYYWQFVALKEKLETIRSAETLLERMYGDVKTAVETGLTTRNNLLRVELEQNRLAGGKLQAENGLQMLKLAFAQHMGLEDADFDVATTAFEDLDPPPPIVATPGRASLQNRLEYRLLEKSVDVARLQRDLEIGKRLPTVAIGAGYNWLTMDMELQTKTDKNAGMVFAAVSVPISDWWGGSHAIKRKKLELKRTENTRQEQSDLLLLQMRQLRNRLQEAFQQIAIARKSITSAEENLKIIRDNFEAGVSTLSDLLEAQNLLQQSRDQYVEAASDYFIKLAEYKTVAPD